MAPSSSASPAKAPSSVSVAHKRVQNRAYSDIIRERSESPPPKKLRSMKEIMAVAKHVQLEEEEEEDEEEEEHDQGSVVCSGAGKEYENLVCEQCGSGEKDDEILLCDKCDKGFHMLCVRPIVVRVPIGQWFCPSCTADQRRPIKSTHKQIPLLSFAYTCAYLHIHCVLTYMIMHVNENFTVLIVFLGFSQKKIDDFFRIQKGSKLVMKCTSPQGKTKCNLYIVIIDVICA